MMTAKREVTVAKLLVLGATGYVGGIITRLALDDLSVTEVIAPTRRPLLFENPRLKNPIVNFDALDEQASWWRVDAAISRTCQSSLENKIQPFSALSWTVKLTSAGVATGAFFESNALTVKT
jgi:hypothetical protein